MDFSLPLASLLLSAPAQVLFAGAPASALLSRTLHSFRIERLSCGLHAAGAHDAAPSSIAQLLNISTRMPLRNLKTEMDTQLPPNLRSQQDEQDIHRIELKPQMPISIEFPAHLFNLHLSNSCVPL